VIDGTNWEDTRVQYYLGGTDNDVVFRLTNNRPSFKAEERLLSFELLGFGTFMLISLLRPGLRRSTILVLLAVVLLLAAQRATAWEPVERSAGRVAVLGIVGGTALALGSFIWPQSIVRFDLSIALVPTVLAAAIVGMGSAAIRFGARRRFRFLAVVVIVGIVIAIGVLNIHDDGEPIDVLDIHRSASEVLGNGENPYVTARASNTSPLAPAGAEFVGYVYPPTTLVAFVLSDWLLGDPRWASVAAVGAFVVLLVSPWTHLSQPVAGARVALALLVVSQPFLGFVINRAWTDLIALPLLLGSGMLWRRHPYASSLLLGLALSTKPYFVLALPLLLLWPDAFRWRRVGVTGGVIAATYLPFFLADPTSIVRTLQLGAAGGPYRPDSLGLAGLGIEVPTVVSLGVAIGLGIWIGRRAGKPERFFVGLALVLAVAFLTGYQSFINYWFLVAGLVVVAIAVRYSTDGDPDDSMASSRHDRSASDTAAGGDRFPDADYED
jgi:hypothetical protein